MATKGYRPKCGPMCASEESSSSVSSSSSSPSSESESDPSERHHRHRSSTCESRSKERSRHHKRDHEPTPKHKKNKPEPVTKKNKRGHTKDAEQDDTEPLIKICVSPAEICEEEPTLQDVLGIVKKPQKELLNDEEALVEEVEKKMCLQPDRSKASGRRKTIIIGTPADVKPFDPHQRRWRNTLSARNRSRKRAHGLPDVNSEADTVDGVDPKLRALYEEDKLAEETHPILIYLRTHTPVKTCGRCVECRKKPCGQCINCYNGKHLSSRSHECRRCSAHSCNKLTPGELARWTAAQSGRETANRISKDLTAIREKLMMARTAGMSDIDMQTLVRARDDMLQELEKAQTLFEPETAIERDIPDDYENFLLTIQTLESDRDRLARLLVRRVKFDSTGSQCIRRQLRNRIDMNICEVATLFAEAMVSKPYVSGLVELARDRAARIHNA